jgi:hypothetical protein
MPSRATEMKRREMEVCSMVSLLIGIEMVRSGF